KPPIVSIDRVLINGREYPPDRTPALQPGPGNLEFGYSALDYQAPQKIQYRYKLAGFDSDWVDAGSRREAFYTNIRPGRYQFQVQACNADGVWNTAGTSFALELPREFTQTPAFWLACLAVALSFGAFVADTCNWRKHALFWKPPFKNAPRNCATKLKNANARRKPCAKARKNSI